MTAYAGLTEDQSSALDRAMDVFQPEARELIESIEGSIVTTQNGYGRVMGILTALGNEGGTVFLLTMAREGYPVETAEQLAGIMGYTSVARDLIKVVAP